MLNGAGHFNRSCFNSRARVYVIGVVIILTTTRRKMVLDSHQSTSNKYNHNNVLLRRRVRVMRIMIRGRRIWRGATRRALIKTISETRRHLPLNTITSTTPQTMVIVTIIPMRTTILAILGTTMMTMMPVLIAVMVMTMMTTIMISMVMVMILIAAMISQGYCCCCCC